ncbi:MAG TPA: hypothetical protein VKX39_04620 [Bryobacteraceae bacterium]|nr:hypothetical protein [Bryobacteraceae bacterium]
MGDSYLDARLHALRRTQNPDGGWPYFAGKQSWLEPTVYAALALHGEPAADRAWKLLQSWQTRSGAFRPAADVQMESWGTALCITLAVARGEFGDPFERGVEWLLKTEGEDSNLLTRAASAVGLFKPDRNPRYHGWPWKPGTSSWVEPTAHALVALKLASAKRQDRDVTGRIRLGQAELLDLRASDGGWNYGNRTVWGVDLPSYPETTALALIGLQASGVKDVLDAARKIGIERVSPLARAWLAIALRLYGVATPAPTAPPTPDLMLTALEALGCANYRYFKTGGEA